jgi:tetratricopeptide (TPR) repeat protein
LFGRSPAPLAISPELTAEHVERAWGDYQDGRLGNVIAALPGLIGTSQHLEDLAVDAESNTRRGHWAVSARTHHLAATTLSKIGEADLAWIAAERAMQAADQADDALVLASAARAGTHALLAVGRYADALDLGTTASQWLSERLDDNDPAALSLYGMLQLRTAVAAGRRQDRSTATELLARASDAANRLGRDANYWTTGFGPTNVEMHRLSVALDLGDVAYVVDRASAVRVDGAPVERRVSHLIDLSRALSLVARDSDALSQLLTAEHEAPQLVRHNPGVRETIKTMHRRAPATAGRSSSLLGLAERCRAVE